MASLAQRFQDGGLFMWFILLFGIMTIAFIVERYLALYKNYRAAPPGFRKGLLDYITKSDFKGAYEYAKNYGNTSLGKVAAVGCDLRGSGSGEEELQARMDERLAQEVSKTDKRTGFLAMFGNVSTLLGLLGTLVGMIHSFSGVAAANPTDRATLLSQGISEALNCTAFGLLVAITALVAYAVFQNRTDRVVTELTESASEIYHDLLFFSEPGAHGLRTESPGLSGKKAEAPALEA